MDAAAQQSLRSKPEAPPLSDWARGNRVLLGVTQPAVGLSAEWKFERSASGEIRLDRREDRAGRPESGTLLLIDGALLARDARLPVGKELDAMNGPLLVLQLVLQLLERSVPGGPAQLVKDVKIDIAEPSRAISVSGIGAEGEFGAPWRLTGTIGPGGKGIVKFELDFVSSVRGSSGGRYETAIAGIWQNTPPPVVFEDAMSLGGWQVYRIRPVVRARGAVNTVTLGTSAAMGFPNLAEVRRRAAQWVDEQAKRSRWQCS